MQVLIKKCVAGRLLDSTYVQVLMLSTSCSSHRELPRVRCSLTYYYAHSPIMPHPTLRCNIVHYASMPKNFQQSNMCSKDVPSKLRCHGMEGGLMKFHTLGVNLGGYGARAPAGKFVEGFPPGKTPGKTNISKGSACLITII